MYEHFLNEEREREREREKNPSALILWKRAVGAIKNL
jgi:hypothetical protein